MSNEQNKAPAVPQGEPVAWFEYNESLDAWFLAYSRNPNAKTRPLVFGDVSATPAAPSLHAVPQGPVCAALGDIVSMWDQHVPSEYVTPLHMQAKRALAGQQPVSPDMHGWCAYVGGMVAHWVVSEPDAFDRLGPDRFEAAIAGIIERRLWAMPKSATPAAPSQEPQRYAYLDGVNVERLQRAMSIAGCAADPSIEGLVADLSGHVNRLTAAVANCAPTQKITANCDQCAAERDNLRAQVELLTATQTPGTLIGGGTPSQEPVTLTDEQSEEIESLRTQVGILKAAVESRGKTIEQMKAAAAAVPQGWKLVPVEPTLRMLDVGWGICGGDGHPSAQPNRQKINVATANYSAMLAATPAAPSQPVTAALRDLVAAVQKEMSPDWICSSYHPHLHSALYAAIAALREKQGGV